MHHRSTAASTQHLVRTTMAQLGGYWRPLPAVARLLEELGELAELLENPMHSLEELASELADLWIITTAVADQFLGDVAEPGSRSSVLRGGRSGDARTADAPDDALSSLVVAAGQIARIVNYYDGPKTPRSLVGWPSLSDAVATFHLELAGFARAQTVDLGAAVSDKVHAMSSRDAGRFARAEHDPSTAPCLEQFRRTETTVLGIDISAARLWGAPAWAAQSPAANAAAIVPTLSGFTRAASRERLDGYVIAGPTVESIELAGDWAQAVLSELGGHGDRLEREPFMFKGVPLLATVLTKTHPYILLQLSDVEHRRRAR
jgi:hypothetical protein